jgi:long-chain fatty acid transport protein
MNKYIFNLATTCALGLIATPLLAGGIINKQNVSADYFRTLNRQAATDYADVAVYNPAGIMKMRTGKYLKLDGQFLTKDYVNTMPGAGRMDQDEYSIIPGFFAIHKEDKWAGYMTAGLVGGGGKVDYQNGNARSVLAISNLLGVPFSVAGSFPQRVEAKSIYLGYTVGGAYAINEVFSLSAGLRYVSAYKEYTLSATALPVFGNTVTELRDDADGWGGILGINISPNDRLNIGIRYETATKLDFELDARQGAPLLALMGYNDGRKQREDLPALLGAGISYIIQDNLKVDANLIYYFEKDATWETGFDGAGDSYDLGLSLEYRFNKEWMASVGYLYSNLDIDVEQIRVLPEEPKLDGNTFALGGVWSPTDVLDFTIGVSRTFYTDATDSFGITYEKDVWAFSCGLQWKFR